MPQIKVDKEEVKMLGYTSDSQGWPYALMDLLTGQICDPKIVSIRVFLFFILALLLRLLGKQILHLPWCPGCCLLSLADPEGSKQANSFESQ